MCFTEDNQQLFTPSRRNMQFFSPPRDGRRRNQIIKCEKQRRKRKGTFLSARLLSWGYLLMRGALASDWASHRCIRGKGLQRGSGKGADRDKKDSAAPQCSTWQTQTVVRDWQVRHVLFKWHHVHQSLLWMGPLAVCMAWAPMICLDPLWNSWFHCHNNGRKRV